MHVRVCCACVIVPYVRWCQQTFEITRKRIFNPTRCSNILVSHYAYCDVAIVVRRPVAAGDARAS